MDIPFAWRMLAAAVLVPVSFAAPASLPLVFEPNRGQTADEVRYLSRGGSHALYLHARESVLTLRSGDKSSSLRMLLENANGNAEPQAESKLEGHSNYLIGSNRSRWRTDIPHFGKVRYRSVYPGIDLVYYGKEGQLEYDFVVAPGSDPARIRFRLEGARHIRLSPDGDLVMTLANGEARHRKPVIYQETAGGRSVVEGQYRLRGNQVAFEIGEYDRKLPLVIDPILSWSGYIGGAAADTGTAIAVDSQGNAYITGLTQSLTGFPTSGGFQTTHGGSGAAATDAFVTKINAAGNAIVYSTYLGGSSIDSGQAIAVNAAGEAYVAGHTSSTNFPTVNPLRATLSGTLDGFVVRIAAAGNALVFGTLIGGSAIDYANSIAIDTAGTIYAGGYTTSTDLPAAVTGQSLSGTIDGYVMKLSQSQILFSAYIGGSGSDYIYGIAVDGSQNIYVTGRTGSTNTYTGTFRTGNAGADDAFVSKLNASGQHVFWTYLGGSGIDIGRAIALDASGAIYVAGDTGSTNFPRTSNAFQTTYGGVSDAFALKLNPAATDLDFSTYLGGSDGEFAYGIAVQADGHVYVAGQTLSADFPKVGSIPATGQAVPDAFVTKLAPDGRRAVYSTLAGGAGNDQANGIAIDAAGSAYIVGLTQSGNLVSSIPGGALNGTQDAFFLKIANCAITLAPPSATPGTAGGAGSFSVQAPAGCSWTAFASDAFIQITGSASGTGPGTINYSIAANSGAARSGSIVIDSTVFPITQSGVGTTVTPPYNIDLTAAGSGMAVTFTARYGTARPGGAPIRLAYLLINSALNPAGACYVEYSVTGNTFRLLNDAGNEWSSTVLSNSQCSLSLAGASGTVSIPTSAVSQLDVALPLTFSGSFAGPKNVYLLAVSDDSSVNSGWEAKGTWTVTAPGQVGVSALSPLSGAGTTGTFTGTFTHTGGANQHYLGYILFLPTPNVVNYTATGSCLVEYNRISNGMRLIDNAGTGWLGGISGIPLGTPGAVLSNNQCTVSVQTAAASVNGHTMTVTVSVVFNAAIGPVLGTFLQALDVNGIWTGMTQFGNWVLPGAPQTRSGPTIAGLTPSSVTGSSATYTMSASSPALVLMHLRISSAIVGQPACHVVYFVGSNTLNLINDTGTALVSPTGVTPGSASTLSNGLCTVNAAGAAVSATGITANVTVPVSFNAGVFGGAKSVYVNAFDNAGLLSHWVQGGVITVQ